MSVNAAATSPPVNDSAFARWLDLPGDDPYLAVLALEHRSDDELARLVASVPGYMP